MTLQEFKDVWKRAAESVGTSMVILRVRLFMEKWWQILPVVLLMCPLVMRPACSELQAEASMQGVLSQGLMPRLLIWKMDLI